MGECNMDVSVIIVAWSVREWLEKCLESVFKETASIEFEIIYVDNASEDGSVEMVRSQFPSVKIIENDENKGFNKANNQGIKVAKGRYILLLNSDTVILDNAIGKTVKFADEHPDIGVLGCKALNADQQTFQRTCFMYPSFLNLFLAMLRLNVLFPKSKFFGREKMTWWNYDAVREVETVCGVFSLIRKKALGEDFLDERYFMYGDDPDLCFRIKQKGWKIIFMPEAEIIHFGDMTTRRMKREFRWQQAGAILLFMRLRRSSALFPFAILLTAAFFLLRFPVWLFAGCFARSGRQDARYTAITYLIGAWLTLTNWKKLLMNEKELRGKL